MVDTSSRLDSAENLDCCCNELEVDMNERRELKFEEHFSTVCINELEIDINEGYELKLKDRFSRRGQPPLPNRPNLPRPHALPSRPKLPVKQQQSSLEKCKNRVNSLTAQVNTLKSTLNKTGVSVNIVPLVFRKPSQTELVSVTKRIRRVLNKPFFGKKIETRKRPDGREGSDGPDGPDGKEGPDGPGGEKGPSEKGKGSFWQ